MIYTVQVISILFAVVLAKHDAPATDSFEANSISNLQMARFHRYNNWVKFFFCLLAAITEYPDWLQMLFSGGLSFLWIYLLFDPVLNKNRDNISWDYIGSNDSDGRRWIKWFGKNAGEVKAIILSALIIGGNVLYLFVK